MKAKGEKVLPNALSAGENSFMNLNLGGCLLVLTLDE